MHCRFLMDASKLMQIHAGYLLAGTTGQIRCFKTEGIKFCKTVATHMSTSCCL